MRIEPAFAGVAVVSEDPRQECTFPEEGGIFRSLMEDEILLDRPCSPQWLDENEPLVRPMRDCLELPR
jgi:hypothetical protein